MHQGLEVAVPMQKTSNANNMKYEKTYAKKITKEDEEIIWDLEAENVIAKIHALSPSPGSYFNYNGEKLKIFECKLSDKIAKKIGHIIVKDDSLFIACKDKYIEILEIQKPGKNKQKIKEFLIR